MPYSSNLRRFYLNYRIYLNELGTVESLPLGSALMVLTTTPENQAVEIARELIDRVQQSEIAAQRRRGIIEMITTILVYKFANLSRREIEQMVRHEAQCVNEEQHQEVMNSILCSVRG